MKLVKPHKLIEKSYLHARPCHEDLTRFVCSLVELDNKLRLEDKENVNKTLFMNFLRDTFYGSDYIVNELNNVDLTVSNSSNPHKPFVLIEAKRYGSNEMITEELVNRKALRQLILYYLREERKNREVRYLMITDYERIFLFDKLNFLRLFYDDKSFRKEVLSCNDQNYRTGEIYDELISKKIDEVKDSLECTILEIGNVRKVMHKLKVCEDVEGRCEDFYTECRELRYLYKLLSETSLRKQSYQVDHNSLNEDFYRELLYVMGLHEVIRKGTAYIEHLPRKDRDENSLLEQSIRLVEDHCPAMKGEEVFENALALVITWINRLLFIKLFEAQLLRANIIEKKFLTADNVSSFSELEYLFVRVLGHKEIEGDSILSLKQKDWEDKYSSDLYLNSSLFDLTEQEKLFVTIDCIYNNEIKKVYKHTKLKYKDLRADGSKRKTLDYILDFLDIYDFGVEATADAIKKERADEHKPIINAAVLGKIFEKINGYKDGAFFTPSHISQFVCKDILRKAVLDKVNTHFGWSLDSFDVLVDNLSLKDKEIRREVNDVINTLTICDPAVGSGHFLVSTLNELVSIKYELGVLEYWNEGKPMRDYDISVENDELVIVDGEGDYFVYNPKNVESQRLQKTLYEEKRLLIQNCLFGADLNNKSVEICRLRLWIELLKNIYREKKVLRTLPNIDINIKYGNSLLSRNEVKVGECAMGKDEKEATRLMLLYKTTLHEYKNCDIKSRKSELATMLNNIKSSRIVKEQVDLFGKKSRKRNAIDEAYEKSVEWMVEFPEVLNEVGEFEGFDVIVGNPPYIALKDTKELAKAYGVVKKDKKTNSEKKLYETFDSDGDVYALFFELGLRLLRKGGLLAYITSNKWLRNQASQSLRKLLWQNSNPMRLINFRGLQLFKNATVETSILSLQKKGNEYHCQCVETTKEDKVLVIEDLGKLADNPERVVTCKFDNDDNWAILTDFEKSIIRKMDEKGVKLNMWENNRINRGLLTGKNEVFVLDSAEKRDEILRNCVTEEELNKTKEIIQPVISGENLSRYNVNWSDNWIINTHNGIVGKQAPVDINKLPALKAYLDSHFDEIKNRSDQGVTPYNLRDCAFLSDLEKEKIVWGELSDKSKFALGGSEIPLNSVFFLVGDRLEEILGQLNSKAILWYFHKFRCTYSGTGTARWLKYIVLQLPLVQTLPESFAQKVATLSSDKEMSDEEKKTLNEELDEMVYDAYGFSEEEKDCIRSFML